jgi:hypothetical protein
MISNYIDLLMKSSITFLLALCLTVAVAVNTYGQNRVVGARSIILDDGSGHTITLQISGVLGANSVYNIPVPPAGNPPAGFVNTGSAPGQTLYWNSTNSDWEASSVITNNTNGNGTNVTVTAPVVLNNSLSITGDVTKIKNVTYSWPSAQASAGAQVLTNDGSGNLTWSAPGATTGVVVPDVVNFLAAYNSGTTYSANDLVSSGTLETLYYSLVNSNTNNTPASSPTFWQPVQISQLNAIHKTLTLSSPGFTSLVSTELSGLFTDGGRIFYTVTATDGGSQIATEEGVIQYNATTNSITCTVQTTDKLHLGTVNSGCTPGFFSPGSHPGVSIFDNVSFSSPAAIVTHDVYYRIVHNSGVYAAGAVTPNVLRLEP